MPQFWSESVAVVANQDLDKVIEIETSSMSGMVFTSDGFAAKNAMVRIRGRDESEEGRSRSMTFSGSADGQGRFEFTRIPAGRYSLEAIAIGERNSRGSLADIEVLAGLSTLDVQVTVIRTVVVSGTVDYSAFEGGKPRWAFLEFRREDEEQRELSSRGRVVTSGGTMIGDDGTFEVEDLLPGAYRIRVRSNSGSPYEHPVAVQVGNADMKGLVIRPVREQEPR